MLDDVIGRHVDELLAAKGITNATPQVKADLAVQMKTYMQSVVQQYKSVGIMEFGKLEGMAVMDFKERFLKS